MTRESLYATAVAFHASRDERHLRDLSQSEIETVLGMVSDLRDGRSPAWIMAQHARPTVSLKAADRLRREFWADQRAAPRSLP